MTDHSKDPARRCLKLEFWPRQDQELWSLALRAADILDEPGLASHWAPATIHKNRRGYGRWLNFLERLSPEILALHPKERVTVDAIRHYLGVLEHQALAPYTIIARLAELCAVISVFAPEEDWGWLWRAIDRFRFRAKPKLDKKSNLIPSSELFQWGLGYMEAAEAGKDTIRGAVRFRDGLMIALLAARPLRRSNLVSIEIGRHLVRNGDGWGLVFEAHEMKNRCPLEMTVPDKLVPFLDCYLNRWRPLLLQDSRTDRLWLTQYAKPMTGDAAHTRITRVTERAFGRRLNPHLFRDCAATSIAIEDPDHVHIAATILGHTSLRTTEKHYNQATSIEAGRQFQKSLGALRREIREQNSGKD